MGSLDLARQQIVTTMSDQVEILEAGTVVDDPLGSSTGPDVVVATVRGQLAPLSAREAVDAARVAPDTTAVVRFPYGTNVTARSSLRINGQVYNVTGIITHTHALQVKAYVRGGPS